MADAKKALDIAEKAAIGANEAKSAANTATSKATNAEQKAQKISDRNPTALEWVTEGQQKEFDVSWGVDPTRASYRIKHRLSRYRTAGVFMFLTRICRSICCENHPDYRVDSALSEGVLQIASELIQAGFVGPSFLRSPQLSPRIIATIHFALLSEIVIVRPNPSGELDPDPTSEDTHPTNA